MLVAGGQVPDESGQHRVPVVLGVQHPSHPSRRQPGVIGRQPLVLPVVEEELEPGCAEQRAFDGALVQGPDPAVRLDRLEREPRREVGRVAGDERRDDV